LSFIQLAISVKEIFYIYRFETFSGSRVAFFGFTEFTKYVNFK